MKTDQKKIDDKNAVANVNASVTEISRYISLPSTSIGSSKQKGYSTLLIPVWSGKLNPEMADYIRTNISRQDKKSDMNHHSTAHNSPLSVVSSLNDTDALINVESEVNPVEDKT